MSRATIGGAKAELFTLLAPSGVPAVSGITAAYPFEPGKGQMQKPVALTVATTGLTATAYLFAVRIYAATDVDAKVAQDNLDTILQATDVLLEPYWGPGDWSVAAVEDLDAIVAECQVAVGREDGRLRPGGFGE